jgi:endonuclease YncB( thermonuclease family)
LRQPRRIFRSSVIPRPGPWTFRLAALAVIAALAFAGLATLPRLRLSRLGGSMSPAAGVEADASHVAVIDGETLRLGQAVVRLFGIEAPKRGVMCHRPDGSVVDCGAAAANALAAAMQGRDVRCSIVPSEAPSVPLARCEAGPDDLSRSLITAGWARATEADRGLVGLEAAARTMRPGLWASSNSD